MNLREFMKTDEYRNADFVEYIGADGVELECGVESMNDAMVIDYNQLSGGGLEIQLDVI